MDLTNQWSEWCNEAAKSTAFEVAALIKNHCHVPLAERPGESTSCSYKTPKENSVNELVRQFVEVFTQNLEAEVLKEPETGSGNIVVNGHGPQNGVYNGASSAESSSAPNDNTHNSDSYERPRPNYYPSGCSSLHRNDIEGFQIESSTTSTSNHSGGRKPFYRRYVVRAVTDVGA